MNIEYSKTRPGAISSFCANGINVPFGDDLGPSFYYKHKDGRRIPVTLSGDEKCAAGEAEGVRFTLSSEGHGDHLTINATIENVSDKDFAPEFVGLKIGIDTYMIEYPQWNDVFFPTFLRCEKTHFWGYFMSPSEKVVSITCDTPVAAWELDYNYLDPELEDEGGFGHRIHTANLLLLCSGELPERHPQDLRSLKAGEKRSWVINMMPLSDIAEFRDTVSGKFSLPVIDFDAYTLEKGRTAHAKVYSNEEYDIETVSPSGLKINGENVRLDEYGAYQVTLKTASGKQVNSCLYCRHDYAWYLKNARKNAVAKPQKAATHTESWYGHFSAFLAKKHFPDPALDRAAQANFDEIMPLMYDFESGKPIIIPQRIQNTACLLGLLVDAYEADPENGRKYLDFANNMAQDLIRRQTPDGAYRKNKEHYTAVIYISKSMLELALCEKELADDPVFAERYEKHYASAKAAVDDLCALRETIGTEGEHTLEDGMISCSALQLGFFALTLPENERGKYIEAAEHMLDIHACLEQNVIPDCRMRGATLRFWEAQYDVMLYSNMLNSPHGWTSWKSYATYYLYLLTGKESYLRRTVDTVGACMQLIDETGNLRWAFIADPYLNVRRALVPDFEKESPDGYESAKYLDTKAYRGKYVRRIIGEEYVDMISDWYRACPEGRMMGGYPECPLIYENSSEWVDNQGGSCDNDVHEHFKCMEETLFEKAFVIVRDDRSIYAVNCDADLDGERLTVTSHETIKYLHINAPCALCVSVAEKQYEIQKGMTMLEVK